MSHAYALFGYPFKSRIIHVMLGARNKTFQFGDPVTTPVSNPHCGSAGPHIVVLGTVANSDVVMWIRILRFVYENRFGTAMVTIGNNSCQNKPTY